jgi:hypothetical protein
LRGIGGNRVVLDEKAMIGVAGLTSLLLGATLAHAADRMPGRVELLEGSGGALFIAGLALLGMCLPFSP